MLCSKAESGASTAGRGTCGSEYGSRRRRTHACRRTKVELLFPPMPKKNTLQDEATRSKSQSGRSVTNIHESITIQVRRLCVHPSYTPRSSLDLRLVPNDLRRLQNHRRVRVISPDNGSSVSRPGKSRHSRAIAEPPRISSDWDHSRDSMRERCAPLFGHIAGMREWSSFHAY